MGADPAARTGWAASVTPAELHDLAGDLVGLPRSLTGPGVRETLRRLAAVVPELVVHEVPTGTPAYDWVVPQEWTLRRAVLTGPDGSVVADSDAHPLAVVGYSDPVDAALDLDELQAHLHSLPDHPDLIPYRTRYYAPGWGFCLPDRVRRQLPPGRYRAVVDAELADGHLTYGEAVLPGETDATVLVTSHVCHPAMANDNVSGNVVAAALAADLAARGERRLTYRVVWAPGTIGALVWLARNRHVAEKVVAAVVLAGVGDAGRLTYRRSPSGDRLTDRVMGAALRDLDLPHATEVAQPWGYDERQLNSPGFDLGAGLLMRTPHGTYPEYHTSADDLAFVSGASLAESLSVLRRAVDLLEANTTFVATHPHGEPRLGERGLYPQTGGEHARQQQLAYLWLLSRCDGRVDLLEIADRSGIDTLILRQAAEALVDADLLRSG